MVQNKILLSDIPKGDDFFKVHTGIASSISKMIKEIDLTENAFNMGLFGDWGCGKSFIINIIEQQLKNDENIVFLNIDVWKFVGAPLMRSMLFDIHNQLKLKLNKEYTIDIEGIARELYYEVEKDDEIKLDGEALKENVRKFLDKIKYIAFAGAFVAIVSFIIPYITKFFTSDYYRNLVNILFPSVGSVGLLFFIVFVFGRFFKKPLGELSEIILFRREKIRQTSVPNFSPEQFQKILQKIFDEICKEQDKKIVLVCDNIDRCEPQLAYETLSTIKTYMEQPHCFYLIPCDDDAIVNYLASEFNYHVDSNGNSSFAREYAKEFIDKFFQTYIRIPLLKEIDRNEYIGSLLQQSELQEILDEDTLRQITQVLYYAYKGNTPRQIKRFVNDFIVYYRTATEIDADKSFLLHDVGLFAIMISIKQKWHDFESNFTSNPSLLKDFISNGDFYENGNNGLNDDLKAFLQNVRGWLPASKPLSPYVYFKKVEGNTNEIIESLRNRNPSFPISLETLGIVKRYIFTLKPGDLFFKSAVTTLWLLYCDEKNNKSNEFREIRQILADSMYRLNEKEYRLMLIDMFKARSEYGKYITLISQIAYKPNVLQYVKNNTIKLFHVVEGEEAVDFRDKLFSAICSQNRNIFNSSDFYPVFSKWAPDNSLLSNLLLTAAASPNSHLFPLSMVDKVINVLDDSFAPVTIKILESISDEVLERDSNITYLSKVQSLLNNIITNLQTKYKAQIDQKASFSLVADETKKLKSIMNLLKEFEDRDEIPDATKQIMEKLGNNFHSTIKLLKKVANSQKELELSIIIGLELYDYDEGLENAIAEFFSEYDKQGVITLVNSLNETKIYKIFNSDKIKTSVTANTELFEACIKLVPFDGLIYLGKGEERKLDITYWFNEQPSLSNISSLHTTLEEKDKESKATKDIYELISEQYIKCISKALSDNDNAQLNQLFSVIKEDDEIKSHIRPKLKQLTTQVVDYFKNTKDIGLLKALKELNVYSKKGEYKNSINIPIMRFLKDRLSSTEDVSKYCIISQTIDSNDSYSSTDFQDVIIPLLTSLLQIGQSKEEIMTAFNIIVKLQDELDSNMLLENISSIKEHHSSDDDIQKVIATISQKWDIRPLEDETIEEDTDIEKTEKIEKTEEEKIAQEK